MSGSKGAERRRLGIKSVGQFFLRPAAFEAFQKEKRAHGSPIKSGTGSSRPYTNENSLLTTCKIAVSLLGTARRAPTSKGMSVPWLLFFVIRGPSFFLIIRVISEIRG